MKKQNILVTPTLLNSYEFAKNAPPSWKARAMKDFIGKIRREKMTFPDWVQKGIAFEDTVYRVCGKAITNQQTEVRQGSEIFRKVANYCLGGNFQSVYKKEIEIDGIPVLFYNKTDVDFPDKIIDIKTTLNYKGEEKYLKGWQHKFYLWASGKKKFEYIVVQWENEFSNKLQSVDMIPYIAPPIKELEEKIICGVREMLEFLYQQGLYDDYFFTFSNNKR